jgi:acetate kinase
LESIVNVLVVNCGSSSLSFKVYHVLPDGSQEMTLAGKARNVTTRTQARPLIEWLHEGEQHQRDCALPSHRAAALEMLAILAEEKISIDAVGHRFVHGGEVFQATTRIDESSLANLRIVFPLAPIHNPNSFSAIEVCMERLPGVPQFVVFDTAFHASLPIEAREYALPRDLAQKYGLRKYGFHGLSYKYVSQRAAEALKMPLDGVKLIMCHLGTGGSSVCAFANGRSIDTSMGFSPLAGLVMSTRCGDIDAEVVLELVRQDMTVDEVSRMLNNQSGLSGLSGYSSNLAEIIAAAEAGNQACRTAYEVYAARMKHYLGAYTWLLNGAHAIVFTDDIGVSSWQLREKVCAEVAALGIQLDRDANRNAPKDNVTIISTPGSSTKLMVLPTDEERVILEEVLHFL